MVLRSEEFTNCTDDIIKFLTRVFPDDKSAKALEEAQKEQRDFPFILGLEAVRYYCMCKMKELGHKI